MRQCLDICSDQSTYFICQHLQSGVTRLSDKRKGKSDARIGGMVATAVLVVLAALTTVVVLIAG